MSYVSEVAADSPVAWYRMQESSGLIQDSSGNANHATSATGTALYAQTGPITSEPTDKAINFDADPTYFSVPDHATLDVGDVFTIEAWIKRNSTGGSGGKTIVAKGGNGYQFWLNATDGGTIELLKQGIGVAGRTTSSPINDTNWHHVVVTKNGGLPTLYIDGAAPSIATAAQTIANTATALTVGSDGSSHADMLMDEVAIYATALSAARVLAHYTAATAAPPTPPAAGAAPTFWVKIAAAGVGAGGGPWDPSSTPTWTDITAYVRSMSWQRGRGSSVDEIGPGTASIRLRNSDRRFEPGFAAGPYDPLRPYRPINIGCTWDGTDYSLFYGFAESWNVIWDHTWGTSYSETEVTLTDAIPLLSNARFKQVFALSALSSARINTVLTSISVKFPTAMREITSSGTSCKATTIPDPPPPPTGGMTVLPPGGGNNYPSAWEVIQAHVATHAGDLPFFIDRRGFACYKADVASGLVFGDSGTELKYTAAALNDGVDQVFNKAEVTAEGGVMQTSSDGTSQVRYGLRTISRTTLSISDAAALAVAASLISRYKDPKARLEGFQVRPGATSALWEALITLDLDHTITVRRRPPGGGTMFEQTPKIVGLQWDVPQIGIPQDTTVGYTLTGAAF